ncbi:hypothetical protein TorRG33x02_189190 [Trema orientale]|uniref:Uncharacterized protein n=1 Tax=Trema orientale TaxID=63057 RepID=A0A2P5EI83_TREOI|nr:hypothetical protein TorRG33x02_189190 [Trema orientale]
MKSCVLVQVVFRVVEYQRKFYTFSSMKDANYVGNHTTPQISFRSNFPSCLVKWKNLLWSKDCSKFLGVSGHDSLHV